MASARKTGDALAVTAARKARASVLRVMYQCQRVPATRTRSDSGLGSVTSNGELIPRAENAALMSMRASTEAYALLLARTAQQCFSATWGLGESGPTGPSGNRHGATAACFAAAGRYFIGPGLITPLWHQSEIV